MVVVKAQEIQDAQLLWRNNEHDARQLEAVLVYPDGTTKEVTWAPQPGSQELLLSCPIPEVLYCGTRGGGKTDTLLMDFAQDCGKGWGAEWRGIIFRHTFPQLEDVVQKAKKWMPRLFPGWTFNEAKYTATWPSGEKLMFRQFKDPSDYWNYHGHAYPWIAWEELTTWPDPSCYKTMFSCNRSAVPGIPIRVRSTTNPFGPGHNWVKARWRLPVPQPRVVGEVIRDSVDSEGYPEPPRVAINSHVLENQILLQAQPDYIQKLRASARSPAELEAWLNGSWDIVAGGMFDDVWYEVRHRAVVKPFIPPDSWRIDRSFDWGSSRPFSVGWWAESDGTDFVDGDGLRRSSVKGDMYRIMEWYGWNGQPNEGSRLMAADIARGIRERELKMPWGARVRDGPADASIFDKENGPSIADDMALPVRMVDGKTVEGVYWEAADKSSGSRVLGWQMVRERLRGVLPEVPGRPRERPGLYIFNTCDQWLRCVPVLPRDEKKMDDVDTDAEDHNGDETRYRVRAISRIIKYGTTTGMY